MFSVLLYEEARDDREHPAREQLEDHRVQPHGDAEQEPVVGHGQLVHPDVVDGGVGGGSLLGDDGHRDVVGDREKDGDD